MNVRYVGIYTYWMEMNHTNVVADANLNILLTWTRGEVVMLYIKEITAVFKGRDGSMGFRKGQEYKLWYFEMNGRFYISRRFDNATAIPYDTMTAIKKNWNIK